MYFGSMNYATRLYIISNHHIVIKLHGLPALGRSFPERLTATSDRISTFDCFFIRQDTVTEIHVYYDDATGILITVSANYVTDFATVRSIYPFTQD